MHQTILNGSHVILQPPTPDICRNINISMIDFVILPSEERKTTLYRRLQFCIKETFKLIIMYEICIRTYRFKKKNVQTVINRNIVVRFSSSELESVYRYTRSPRLTFFVLTAINLYNFLNKN